MLILFDQGTPLPLGAFLTGHTVKTAAEQGWSTLANGKLLDAAEAAGFEVLVTTDKNLPHQQNLARRRLAIVVLGNAQVACSQIANSIGGGCNQFSKTGKLCRGGNTGLEFASMTHCVPLPPPDHPFLNATIGSTPAARRAGIADASSAARPSISAASANITGSHGFTPKS
jgi:hypothetical protein